MPEVAATERRLSVDFRTPRWATLEDNRLRISPKRRLQADDSFAGSLALSDMFLAPALPPEQPRVEAYVDNVTVVLNFTFGPSNGCEFAELEVLSNVVGDTWWPKVRCKRDHGERQRSQLLAYLEQNTRTKFLVFFYLSYKHGILYSHSNFC